MNKSVRLNQKQLTLIITNLLVVKMIFVFTRYLFKTSGNAAWIEAIYITIISMAFLEMSFLFYRYTGNRSIIQLSESIGGIPLKLIVSLAAAAVIGVNVGSEMRTFAESVKIILLPNEKIEYIMILFAVAVGIGSFCGIEAIAVINTLFFPWCLFFLGLLMIMLFKDYDINNLLPVLGLGEKNIFISGISDASCFSDILALNLLLPYCDDIKSVKQGGRKAVLIGGIVITLLCLTYGMVYPYPYSSEFLLVTYQMSRMVRIGEYFQRFEAFFEFVWAIMQLIYASIYIFIICDTLAQGFKLKNYKSLMPCIIAVLSILAFEPASIVDFLEISGRFRRILFPAAFLLPIVLPAVYMIFSHKNYKNQRKREEI